MQVCEDYASKHKSPAQLKIFLVILKIFHIIYLDYLRVCIKAKLPYLMCRASRFFSFPLPFHPIYCGSMAIIRSLTHPVENCWMRIWKNQTTRIIRVNLDPELSSQAIHAPLVNAASPTLKHIAKSA